MKNLNHKNTEYEGFKKTRLGWIPEDWEVLKIKDIAKTTTGGTPNTKKIEYWENGFIPWMSSGELNLKRVRDVKGRITELGLKESSARLIPENSILIGLAGQGKTRGTAAINKIELTTNQSVAAIIIKGNVYYKYVYYNLDNRYEKIRLLSTGAGGRGGLNLSIINGINLALPPLPEQKAIANCLSIWDTAITKLDLLIKAKQQLKKALMQQLLSVKKRLPGFEGEWEQLKFSEISERVKRKNTEVDDTVVTISAQRGFVLQEDFFNKRVASDVLLNYTLVHKGEYCYNKSYSKGYPMGAFKRLDDFEKAVVTTLYVCFRLKYHVDSDFMNHYFEAGKMIPGLMRIAQEGGRAHGLLNIGLPDFFNLPLKLPLKEEQTAIAEVLNTADHEIQLLTTQRDQLKLQKKGLMQQLLIGKKRLKING